VVLEMKVMLAASSWSADVEHHSEESHHYAPRQELQGRLQPRRRRRNGQAHVIGWRDQEDVDAHRRPESYRGCPHDLRELA
jgi:hypothetical protein